MTQVSDRPSPASCARLLRAMPAISAFRRTIRDVAPPESLGWLGALVKSARAGADGIRPSQLADALHVDLSVASRSIAQLEELGYAERGRDPQDGRAWIVHVTDSGRERAEQLTGSFAEHVADRLAGWTDDDVDQFATLLRRFGDSLEAAAHDQAHPRRVEPVA